MSSGQAGKGSGTRRIPRTVRAAVERAVLLEAAYSCANPTCRLPLIHVHHIDYVENGGANTEGNLIALCPNCHARVHQSQIPEERPCERGPSLVVKIRMVVLLCREFGG